MITGVVTFRILGKGAGWTVLKPLVNGQNHKLSGAGKLARVHHARQVGQNAGWIAAVPTEDFSDAVSRHVSVSFANFTPPAQPDVRMGKADFCGPPYAMW